MKYLFCIALILNQLHLITAQSNYPTPPHNAKSLFYIQRSGNISTVVYEANTAAKNTAFDAQNPIHVYWICYQEDSKTMELNYLERKFAYGVNYLKTAKAPTEYDFKLVAFDKKALHLAYDAQQVPYVSTTVSGKNSRLKRVFIQLASKKDWYSLAPKVIAIELFGTDVATGAATYEKIIP